MRGLHIVYILLTMILSIVGQAAYSQNVTFEASLQQTLTFNTVNTVSREENSETKSNALQIRVKNRSGGAKSVYVRASYDPGSTTMPTFPIQLDYKSDNSSHESNLITTPFQVTATDQRMFTFAQHAPNSTYTFTYDVIKMATNWAYPPGTYNFTLTFTFVAP